MIRVKSVKLNKEYHLLVELSFIFFFSFASLFLLRKLAKIIGLVDKPNLRKQHNGLVPLVGGIAVFVTLAQYIYTRPEVLPHSGLFLSSIAVLTIIGAIDDKFDISFKFRLVVQTLLTIAMIYFSGLQLNHIGDVFGMGNIELGVLAPVITIFAVLGAINAFNMVDGIDGLLGGLSIVTFSSIAIILNLQSNHQLAKLCIVIVVAMLPYVLMNLGVLGRKRQVFMGDAGSMMIGFTVIWLLLSASQINNEVLMRPVTALWIIALPLMDMAAIMYRRIKRGRSPFRPDRDHLHHICQRAGLKNVQTLIVICSLASVFAGIGIMGEYYKVHEGIMFAGFLGCFVTYSILLLRNWPKRISELLEESNLVRLDVEKGEVLSKEPVEKQSSVK
jgi:UDP-GlcNAc:undecaprenyl-phosphate GlcNAc-1-phosphate transferase